MKRLALAFALLISSPAYADDDAAFGVHTLSIHAPKRDFNNVNPGFYLREANGVQYGLLSNSYKETSLYLAYQRQTWLGDILVGAASGYPGRKFTPMLAWSKRFSLGDDQYIRTAVLPAWSEGRPALVGHVLYEVDLKD